jgi:hypothetical protein
MENRGNAIAESRACSTGVWRRHLKGILRVHFISLKYEMAAIADSRRIFSSWRFVSRFAFAPWFNARACPPRMPCRMPPRASGEGLAKRVV